MRSLPHDPRKLVAIYLGGVAGALLRVGLAQALPLDRGGWPWATLAVNLVGASLLGYFFASLRGRRSEDLAHPFLAVGVCGTLTTFSTLQLELYEMTDEGRLGLAGAYCAVTLAAGYAAVLLGIALARRRPVAA